MNLRRQGYKISLKKKINEMFNDNDQYGINPPGPVSEAVAAFTQRARRAEVTIVNCMLKKEVLWALLRPIGK
jgi:hypothetical protein